ncbi:NADPH-dependent FMN reductase [Haloarcula marina]|uniref:NADPH-dependent FMN reductase n=1 Tax=Haloarcula marina TaxID=2961574 RepID=UPI0020B8D0C1|nr:NAD(P)H-dependent oxidoreductase [Halomicroarcula marina]
MDEKPFVVAICGSLGQRSTTRMALSYALKGASAEGAETELIDLRKWDIPLFDPDDRDRGDAGELKRTAERADAIIMGTPVYHGMISSALKNAFDYLGKDQFSGTTVGLLATAGGGSYAHTLEHMRTGIRTVHGWTIPHEVGIRNASSVFEDGEITDADIEKRIRILGEKAVNYSNIRANTTRRGRTE